MSIDDRPTLTPGQRLAFTWGLAVRRARQRSNRTQVDVAVAVAVSPSTVCRMELGRGAGFPLDTWAAVAAEVGANLSTVLEPIDRPFGIEEVRRIAEGGGWSRVDGVIAATLATPSLILERGPQRITAYGATSIRPGSMIAIVVADLVTDAERLLDDLAAGVTAVDRVAPTGWSVGGLIVVRRTSSNRRRLTISRRAVAMSMVTNGSRWIGTLRSPGQSIPSRPGLVWMAADGRHLIPRSAYLRAVRAA